MAPAPIDEVRRYWHEHALPFVGLADSQRAVYENYRVGSSAAALGQKPGLFLIDAAGAVRLVYIGAQQWQIPEDDEILGMLKKLF